MTEEYLQISSLTNFIKEAQFPSNTVMDLDAWCRDKAYELYNNENFRTITKGEMEELENELEDLRDDVSDKETIISDLEDDVISRDAIISGLGYEIRELNKIKESVTC